MVTLANIQLEGDIKQGRESIYSEAGVASNSKCNATGYGATSSESAR